MTRERFIKLMMASHFSRNEAAGIAEIYRRLGYSYASAWRIELNFQSFEKKIASASGIEGEKEMSADCKWWEKKLEDVSEYEMLDICNGQRGWDCQTCPYLGDEDSPEKDSST